MLLQVLLLLVSHTLCILHHLLLDAAKKTEGHTEGYYYFPCRSSWRFGSLHWIIVLCDAQDQIPSCRWALRVLCYRLYMCGRHWRSNIHAHCLPFFSLVVPLDDKLHVWRPPTATELQSSTTQQEQNCSATVQIWTHILLLQISRHQQILLPQFKKTSLNHENQERLKCVFVPWRE